MHDYISINILYNFSVSKFLIHSGNATLTHESNQVILRWHLVHTTKFHFHSVHPVLHCRALLLTATQSSLYRCISRTNTSLRLSASSTNISQNINSGNRSLIKVNLNYFGSSKFQVHLRKPLQGGTFWQEKQLTISQYKHC